MWDKASFWRKGDSILALMEALGGFFAAEDPQAAQGQGLHLVLAGVDDHGREEGNVLSDVIGDILGVGDAAGEQDGVHLAAHAGGDLADVLQTFSAMAS